MANARAVLKEAIDEIALLANSGGPLEEIALLANLRGLRSTRVRARSVTMSCAKADYIRQAASSISA
jgi:hypothetical protein